MSEYSDSKLATSRPTMLKTKARVLFLVIIVIAGLGYWKMGRDVSDGRLLKVLIIGGIAVFGGWRAYKQARAAASS